ncbi:hypothetical protein MPTA5024_23215 [Microbispora sp. ATCC PTA-5024]|nr:hypothetical protein MPTA5024_23215 [Microbispora sp. ATCC PTA-5024]
MLQAEQDERRSDDSLIRLGSGLTRRNALKVVLSREFARSQTSWIPRMTC